MIHARASLFDFINSKVVSDLTGITTPEIYAKLIVSGQPAAFPNCLNVNLYDDISIIKSNPPWRKLIGVLGLYIEISDPTYPEEAERKAYEAIHKINNFMAVQLCPKKDFNFNPAKALGSNITWRDAYNMDWRSSPVKSDRYVHKYCNFTARYFEERFS